MSTFPETMGGWRKYQENNLIKTYMVLKLRYWFDCFRPTRGSTMPQAAITLSIISSWLSALCNVSRHTLRHDSLCRNEQQCNPATNNINIMKTTYVVKVTHEDTLTFHNIFCKGQCPQCTYTTDRLLFLF